MPNHHNYQSNGRRQNFSIDWNKEKTDLIVEEKNILAKIWRKLIEIKTSKKVWRTFQFVISSVILSLIFLFLIKMRHKICVSVRYTQNQQWYIFTWKKQPKSNENLTENVNSHVLTWSQYTIDCLGMFFFLSGIRCKHLTCVLDMCVYCILFPYRCACACMDNRLLDCNLRQCASVHSKQVHLLALKGISI